MIPENRIPKNIAEALNMTGNNDPLLHMVANIIDSQENNTAKNNRRPNISNKRLRKDYILLVQRNNLLASALGACEWCWGTDIKCECNGEGKVASRLPDKEAFLELVYPVIRLLDPEVAESTAANIEQKGRDSKN